MEEDGKTENERTENDCIFICLSIESVDDNLWSCDYITSNDLIVDLITDK